VKYHHWWEFKFAFNLNDKELDGVVDLVRTGGIDLKLSF